MVDVIGEAYEGYATSACLNNNSQIRVSPRWQVEFIYLGVQALAVGLQGPLRGEGGAAPCWPQPVPAGSATAPLQGTAEPVSDASGTSGKMYLRKDKTLSGSDD